MLDRKARVLAPLVGVAGRVGRVGLDGDRRRRHRDRVGQGPPDHARAVRGRGPRGRAPPAAPGGRARRPLRRATRPRSDATAGSTSTTCSDVRRRDRARPRLRGRATLALPPPLRRRVPGRDAAAVAAAPRVARRPPRPLRRRRRRAGDLRVRGRRRVAAHRVRPPLPRRPHDRARATTTGRTARSSRSPRPRSGRHPASSATRRGRSSGRPRAAAIVAFDDDARGSRDDRRRVLARVTGGVPWHRMAVLFRTNAQSSLFETALARRGVPFRLAGAATVRDPARVRAAPRPAPRGRARTARPDRSRTTSPTSPPTRRRRRRTRTSRRTTIAAPVDNAAPDAAGVRNDDELRTHRDALLRSAATTPRPRPAAGRSPGSSPGSTSRRAAESGDERGVDLVTFHRAKGLEWQVVFVTGLERGLVPISWATTPAARAEERRLLHVALGRAEDELHCSWARGAHAPRPAGDPPAQPVARRARAGRRTASVSHPSNRKARVGDALATLAARRATRAHEPRPPRQPLTRRLTSRRPSSVVGRGRRSADR